MQRFVMALMWALLTDRVLHRYLDAARDYGAPKGFQFLLNSHSGERFVRFSEILTVVKYCGEALCPHCGKKGKDCFSEVEPHLYLFPEYNLLKKGMEPMVLFY
jgi:hypothetical protein